MTYLSKWALSWWLNTKSANGSISFMFVHPFLRAFYRVTAVSCLSKHSRVISARTRAQTASLWSRVKSLQKVVCLNAGSSNKTWSRCNKMAIITTWTAATICAVLTKCRNLLPDGCGSNTAWLAWFWRLYSLLAHLQQFPLQLPFWWLKRAHFFIGLNPVVSTQADQDYLQLGLLQHDLLHYISEL